MDLYLVIKNCFTGLITILIYLGSINLNAQDIEVVSTNKLIQVSTSFGLDSALLTTNNIPIYALDTNTTVDLFNHILKNEATHEIESFLIDASIKIEFDTSIKSYVLNEFYQRKYRSYAKDIPLRYKRYLPRVKENSLYALTKFKSPETEKLLIRFYELWQKEAAKYVDDYKKGLEETNNLKRERLMEKCERANQNCIQYLLALKELSSSFYNYLKIEYHNSFVPKYSQASESSQLYLRRSHDEFEGPAFDTTRIKLEQSIKSLEELSVDSSDELKEFFNRYKDDSSCWRFLLLNGNKGILDVGCQYAPLHGQGSFYRVELIEGKNLMLYRLTTWIS